jgi:hypothetical protein
VDVEGDGVMSAAALWAGRETASADAGALEQAPERHPAWTPPGRPPSHDPRAPDQRPRTPLHGRHLAGQSCIPIIPSADLERSLRLWVDGLGFTSSSEMWQADRLIFCMLRKDTLWFMLSQRAGSPVTPENYEGIRLYWAPGDLGGTRERLKRLGYAVSEIADRDYGQTEFFLTDDDGHSHCFGVPTRR